MNDDTITKDDLENAIQRVLTRIDDSQTDTIKTMRRELRDVRIDIQDVRKDIRYTDNSIVRVRT